MVLKQFLYKGRTGKTRVNNVTSRVKRGVMVAVKGAGRTVNVGWSKCSPGDYFDRDRAHANAIARLVQPDHVEFPASESDQRQVDHFAKRAASAFKILIKNVKVV